MSGNKAAGGGPANAKIVLGSLILVAAVANLNLSVANVALPSIGESFDSSQTMLDLIAVGYSLGLAASVLWFGALGDRYGRKMMIVLGMLITIPASIVAGFAPSDTVLFGARVAGGLAAGMAYPTTLALITALWSGPARTRSIAMWSALGGGVAMLGPLLSGFLLQYFAWGSVFLVTVPLAVVALYLASRHVPAHVSEGTEPVDNLGGVLSAIMIGALIMGLNFITVPNLQTIAIGLFAIAIIVLVLFVMRQKRARNPLYDLQVAARRTFWVAAVAGIIVFGSLMGIAFVNQQYLQNVLGYDTLQAGAAILPAAVFMVLIAPRSAKLVHERGSRFTLMLGQSMLAIAFVLMLLLWGEGSPYYLVAIPLIFMGIGVGLAGTPSSNSLTGSVPVRRVGMASGTADLQRDLGGALMTSLFGALLTAGYAAAMGSAIAASGQDITATTQSELQLSYSSAANLAAQYPQYSTQILSAAKQSFLDGDQLAYLAGLGAVLIGLALVFLVFPKKDEELRMRRDFLAQDEGEAAAPADPTPAPPDAATAAALGSRASAPVTDPPPPSVSSKEIAPMPDVDRSHLPIRRPSFGGVANRTLAGSQPDWNLIGHPTPPAGAPNVLLVLIDDAGFGNPSTFGGPIQTPNYTRIAEGGIRYNRFHVTAICSPTRAALLTGRNSHAVGFGSIGEFAGGYPGYSATLPRDSAPLPRILRDNGYSTAAFGKWHLTPDGLQGPAGPFDRWPAGWGFEYFYGFLGGGAGQWDTVLAENQKIIGVDPKYGDETDPYYLPDAMADKTIEWLHGIRAQDATKPFFAYFSTGCSHAPHHVAETWAAKYKGKFDQGWDRLREETFARQKALGVVPAEAELTPRNEAFPAWDDVPAKLKPFYARQMEVYAGFSENADYNVGRVIDAIDELGELDNTLIIWIWGDNGASMEGTVTGSFNELTMQNGIPLTDEMQLQLSERYGGMDAWGAEIMAPHYGAAWAWAGNTPFQWGKQVGSHLGGTRNPMVIRWPGHAPSGGGLRSQFTHVIDIAPTILEIAGIPAPTTVDGISQQPLHGITFADSLAAADAPERHTQQYFESVGNRTMYKDGWWLSMRTARIPWVLTPQAIAPYAPGVWDPDADPTELYYLPDDFSQAHDLAGANPDKVAELKALFWEEAERYQVLPLLATLSSFFGQLPPLPATTKLEFRGDVQNVLSGMIPRVYNHSYTISADLAVPEGGAEGVIVAEADHLGGFSLFVEDGKLTHTYSMMGVFIFRQQATEALPPGEVNVRMEFVADAPKPATGGQVTLYIDDKAVGGGHMEHTVPMRFSGYAGMDIGRDNGGVVDRSYASKAPFPFTGTIRKVIFDIKPHLEHEEAELHASAQHADVAHALSA